MAYKLKIGDTTSTLQDLGIVEAIYEEDMDGSTSLRLTVAQSFQSAPIIAPFQRCDLYEEPDEWTSNWRFSGWLDEAPRFIDGSSESVQYTLNGPMRQLERTMVSQSLGGLALLGGAAGSRSDPMTLSDAITALLSDTFTGLGWGLWVGSGGNQIPARQRSDVSLADALRTLMTFAPGVAIKWQYGVTDDAPAGIGMRLSSGYGEEFNLAQHTFFAVSVNPRYDLLYDRVTIHWMREGHLAATHTVKFDGTDADLLGANRTKTYTFDTDSMLSVPEPGLHDALAGWYGRLRIDAEISRDGVDWDDVVIGEKQFFVGTRFAGLPPWSDSPLIAITCDLIKNTSHYRLGASEKEIIYDLANRTDYDKAAGNISGTAGVFTGLPDTFSPSEIAKLKDWTGGAIDGDINPADVKGLEDALENLENLQEEKLETPPDTATGDYAPEWITVERCDGKTLQVLSQGGGWKAAPEEE